jgi:hypothetical protein
MIQRPVAVGLKVCERAILDAYTGNVSLVNCFSQLQFVGFPAPPQSFSVCAVLNDGMGEAELTLAISHLASFEDIDKLWVRSWKYDFDDPLQDLWFLVRFDDCSFPEAGRYLIALSIANEQISQATLEVFLEEEEET